MTKKTSISEDIIKNAVKPDKVYWDSVKAMIAIKIENKQIYTLGLQKHLFQIKKLSDQFPNSGSVLKALSQFQKRIEPISNRPQDFDQIISIVEDILIHNPRSIDAGTAILSKLLTFINQDQITLVVDKILNKFRAMPNTDYLEIWLQRLTLIVDKSKTYKAGLCKKVSHSSIKIWNSNWLKDDFEEDSIIDNNYIETMKPIIPHEEIDLFDTVY